MPSCRCFTFLIALGFALPTLSVHADQRYVLTSTEQNLHRDNWKLSGGNWSVEQLPYLTIWKNTAATEDGYVTGIEPATGYPYNRKVERAAGRVPKLSPGQKRRFTLDIGLHRGEDNVNAAVKQIQSLQGDHPVDVQREPPKS